MRDRRTSRTYVPYKLTGISYKWGSRAGHAEQGDYSWTKQDKGVAAYRSMHAGPGTKSSARPCAWQSTTCILHPQPTHPTCFTSPLMRSTNSAVKSVANRWGLAVVSGYQAKEASTCVCRDVQNGARARARLDGSVGPTGRIILYWCVYAANVRGCSVCRTGAPGSSRGRSAGR